VTETATGQPELRTPFAAEQVGKLPRVTCPECSDRRLRCDKHEKAKCDVCQAWVSTKHIHIDYVGHADVTSRLLDVDPEWSWDPKATEPDKDALAAAVASGNPEVVKMVIENAPPKFDLDDRGNPVGFWIRLTVGGVTRPGYGSVPSGQPDAVKVLIGDALRNAAMRFGVALELWAKGDRADPAAENATASAGRAEHRRNGNDRQAALNALDSAPPPAPQNARPAAAPPPPPPPPRLEPGDPWAAKIDAIHTVEDADNAERELKEQYDASEQTDADKARTSQVLHWIRVKAAPMRTAAKSGAKRETAKPDEPTPEAIAFCTDFATRLRTAPIAALQAMRGEIGRAVAARTISPEDGNGLSSDVAKRRKELEQQAPAEGAEAA
jgi:hypothetical protein